MTNQTPQTFFVEFQQSPRDCSLDRAPVTPPRDSSNPSHPARPASNQPNLEHLLNQLIAGVERCERNRRDASEDLRRTAIDLAALMTAKLLFRKVETNEFPFHEMAEQMLNHVPGETSLVFHLHARDLEILRAQWEKQASESVAAHRVTWVADPQLPRGSCHVQAPSYGLFFDVGLQINELRQNLLENGDGADTERRTSRTANSNLRRFPDRRSAS